MYGKQDEYFVLLNGQGGNGKGVLLELFKELLSKKYFENGNTCVLTDKQKSSGANTELAKCDKKRTVLYSEPEDGNKLNGATIKYVTGNPVVNARQIHSTKTETKIHAMTIMECNERPAISGRVDNSFLRRIIDILFPTIFVETESDILGDNYKLKDESFKEDDFKEDHKIALFNILCNAKKKVYIPEQVKNRSEKYIYKNDDIYNFIKDNYEQTETKSDIVHIKEIFNDFKLCDSYKLLSNDDKKSLNQNRFTEVFKSNPKFCKYYHQRLKINEKNVYSVISHLKPKQAETQDFI